MPNPASSDAPTAERTSRGYVLVVDDDEGLRRLVRMVLAGKGFELGFAVDGRDALAQLERRKPDLVVLDVMMEQVGGVEVLRHLRSNPATADVKVLMLSAIAPGLGMWQVAMDADGYMTKPFSPRELLARVERLLGSR